jgi:4-oxalocrotonate tautomerase
MLRELIHSLTNATVDALGVPKANVRVVLREVPLSHFAAGDVTLAERDKKND